MHTAPDLLTWPERKAEIDAHEAAMEKVASEVQRAELDYAEATRRLRRAPHGQVEARRAALRTATNRLLAAELSYAEAQKDAPSWE